MAEQQYTNFLELIIYPDITGVYQRELRESYMTNFVTIDEAVKTLDNALKNVSIPIATVEVAGKVKPDGTSITIDEDGTIHAKIADVYTKEQVDEMMAIICENVLSVSDIEALGDVVDVFMGETNTYTGLGGSIMDINALADEILS